MVFGFFWSILSVWWISLRFQVAGLGATYNLFIFLLLIARLLIGEELWIVALLNNIMHLLLLAVIPAGLTAILAPKYRLIYTLYALPGLVFFTLWLAPLLMPKYSTMIDTFEVSDLRVLTYNVQGMRDPVLQLAGEDVSYDIVAFQEMNTLTIGEGVNWAHVDRTGIYSQYPIMTDTVKIVGGGDEALRPIGLRVLVNISGHAVAIYNIHPPRPEIYLRPFGYSGHERRMGYVELAAIIEKEQYPIILLCDCNFTRFTDDYHLLDEFLDDAWLKGGWGLGLTAPAPNSATGFPIALTRSDYIWYSDHFDLKTVRVLDDTYSDHYPVEAILRFR